MSQGNTEIIDIVVNTTDIIITGAKEVANSKVGWLFVSTKKTYQTAKRFSDNQTNQTRYVRPCAKIFCTVHFALAPCKGWPWLAGLAGLEILDLRVKIKSYSNDLTH